MEKKFEKQHLVKKSENFSQWYIDVILKSGLADYAPVKGCQVIRPYGFAIWENIKRKLGEMIKEAGVKNAYFPLFIPYSFLEKEKKHVKEFSPELAVVTHGGGKKLKEPLVVRPTSETIMYDMFSKWIKSWRDLPFLINQWCNVVRWEKRTYLFLRTTEFLWQEGHTAHATEQEAQREAVRALKMYQTFDEKYLAIPVMVGTKSEAERFPGANVTYATEALMPNGKALQAGTSHELGQNFSQPFEISFLDKKGKSLHVWQTSWGLSTRIMGAIIMVHGDDNGLNLPPQIAPIQVVVIPIFKDKKRKNVLSFCSKIYDYLKKSGFLVELDDRDQYSPGWKFNEWELKGVPLRIEIGEKEIKENSLTLVRRDNNKKTKIKNSKLEVKIQDVLNDIQQNLYSQAKKFLKNNTYTASQYSEFKKIMKTKKGFIWAPWCESKKCEAKIKKETKATTRLLSLTPGTKKGKCIYCNQKARHLWLFAQAY